MWPLLPRRGVDTVGFRTNGTCQNADLFVRFENTDSANEINLVMDHVCALERPHVHVLSKGCHEGIAVCSLHSPPVHCVHEIQFSFPIEFVQDQRKRCQLRLEYLRSEGLQYGFTRPPVGKDSHARNSRVEQQLHHCVEARDGEEVKLDGSCRMSHRRMLPRALYLK